MLTDKNFLDAVEAMRDAIPFFPRTEGGLKVMFQIVKKFVGNNQTAEALDWLVLAAVEAIPDWQRDGGVPKLREIWGKKYPFADVVDIRPSAEEFAAYNERLQERDKNYGHDWMKVLPDWAKKGYDWKEKRVITKAEHKPEPAFGVRTRNTPVLVEYIPPRTPEENERILLELKERLNWPVSDENGGNE